MPDHALQNDDSSLVDPFGQFLTALCEELKWVKESAPIKFLEQQDGRNAPIFQKAFLLGLIDRKDCNIAGQGDPDNGLLVLKRLVRMGKVSPVWFADILRMESGFPLSLKEKGTFAEYLINNELLNYNQVLEALKLESETGQRLESAVVDMQLLPENRIFGALGNFLSANLMEDVEIDLSSIDLDRFAYAFLETFQLLPIAYAGKALQVVSYIPASNISLQYLGRQMGRDIAFRITTKKKYDAAKLRFLDLRKKVDIITHNKTKEVLTMSRDFQSSTKAIQITADSPVEMVATVVQQAVDNRATDIHIQPRRDGVNIRYRVDGFLYEVANVDRQTGKEIVSRIKILADMDITERRLPQDGHFRFAIEDAEYDMRIATVPTNFGERMEIRLAEGGKVFTDIDQLGMGQKDVKTVNSFIVKPHGIVLATGPVGSGKTTTLYSCVAKIDKALVNVMTIEDPIEYIIQSASQIEVNYKVNFDFVHGLRAILRQDPDVILVGEIRDEETAKIAIRAGLTGMLVFSTLHANSAVGSVTTLANFQINRFLIGNALVGSIAQRLVRKICPFCSEPVKVDDTILETLHVTKADLKGGELRKGRGCDNCFNTGYLGRSGLFEVFNVTKNLRTMIMDGVGIEDIHEKAVEEGMVTLREDGVAKVKNGVTTVEEFIRVLG